MVETCEVAQGECACGTSAGQPGGSAHASARTADGGMVDLGAETGNSRANDADEDGDVIVGWDEAPFGHWRPTVWMDGERVLLTEYDASCEASTVNPAGTVITLAVG